jgi:hypothetical protein
MEAAVGHLPLQVRAAHFFSTVAGFVVPKSLQHCRSRTINQFAEIEVRTEEIGANAWGVVATTPVPTYLILAATWNRRS